MQFIRSSCKYAWNGFELSSFQIALAFRISSLSIADEINYEGQWKTSELKIFLIKSRV